LLWYFINFYCTFTSKIWQKAESDISPRHSRWCVFAYWNFGKNNTTTHYIISILYWTGTNKNSTRYNAIQLAVSLYKR